MEQWEAGNLPAGVATLIDAYRADPGNTLVYQILMEYAGDLDERARRQPRYREYIQQIDSLAVPVAARYGGSVADVVTICASLAKEAIDQQNWTAAAIYLANARELLPEDPRIAELQAKMPTLSQPSK
jgi:hypothetical protein